MKKYRITKLLIISTLFLIACNGDPPTPPTSSTTSSSLVVPTPTSPGPTTVPVNSCFTKQNATRDGIGVKRGEVAEAAANLEIISVARKPSTYVNERGNTIGPIEGYEFVNVVYKYSAPANKFARIVESSVSDPAGEKPVQKGLGYEVPIDPELKVIPPGSSMITEVNWVFPSANLNKGNGSLGKIESCGKTFDLQPKSQPFSAGSTPQSQNDWIKIKNFNDLVSVRVKGFGSSRTSGVQDEYKRTTLPVGLELELRNDSTKEISVRTNFTSERFGIVDKSGLATVRYDAYGPSTDTKIPPGLTKTVVINGGMPNYDKIQLSKKQAVAWIDVGNFGTNLNSTDQNYKAGIEAQPLVFVGDLP